MTWADKLNNGDTSSPHKNVLVVYSHNSSAAYLGDQPLNDTIGIAPNYSTCDRVTGRVADEKYLKALQSPDGIQFWHPKHCVGTTTEHPNSIHPAIDAMETYLAERGQSLDGIVLVAGMDTAAESENTINWLKEMKLRFPDVKVLLDGFRPYHETLDALSQRKGKNLDYPQNVIRSTFAFPLDESAIIDTRQKKAVITPSDTKYQLAEPIDRMVVNGWGEDRADQLRELLGMPPYQEKSLGKSV